jgi:hypothetical protein
MDDADLYRRRGVCDIGHGDGAAGDSKPADRGTGKKTAAAQGIAAIPL